MKIVKSIFKLFVTCVIICAIAVGGFVIFMKFHGNALLEEHLSYMFGTKVGFESVTLNVRESSIIFNNFRTYNKIGLDDYFLTAERCAFLLDREKSKKEKRLVFKKMLIKKNLLSITRSRETTFNAVYSSPKSGVSVYDFLENVGELSVEDCVIEFKDYNISREPFVIEFSNFNLNFAPIEKMELSADLIPVVCTFDFRAPGSLNDRGKYRFDAKAFIRKDSANVEMIAKIEYIDLMQFLPYFENYTPFSFNEGIFSSSTNFTMQNNTVDLLVVLVFHELDLTVDPGMENARFLKASVDRLARYLMTKEGDIIFDFVVKGTTDKPRIGLGPNIKFPIGLIVIGELGNLVKQLKKAQMSDRGKL